MSERQLRGRASELELALSVLQRTAHTGQGAMLVVSGEGGIGKTALIREVCSQAGRRGYDVGVGRAEESDRITPMAPVLLALRSGPEPLLSRDAFARLAPIQHQQLWVVDQLVDELETLGLTRPVLVCVDDVQWADHSSVFALGVLPGRLAGSPIVWLIATRPGTTVADELSQAVSRDLRVEQIVLEPLSPASIELLAVDRLGKQVDSDLRHLLAGANGMPFLAVALLDGLAARLPGGRPQLTSGNATDEGEELPDSLVLGVRARLESLPAQSVQLVRIGSVLGRSFTVADAAALLGGPPADTVLPWLEPVVRARVLEDRGDQIVFRHDLLRQAVYADTPASVRRALHRAAAQHMLATGRGPLDAAGHVLRSATVGDRDAIDILRRAARATGTDAPATAAELAERAFSLLTAGSAGWGDAGTEALTLLNAADRGSAAMAVADTLLGSALDNELTARIQIEVAHAMWTRGELDQIRSRVDVAGEMSGLEAGTRAHLLALRALSQCRDEDATGAVREARAALTAGEHTHDRPAQTTALHALGEMARNDGRNDAALEFFHRMRRVAGTDYFHDEVLSLQLLDRFDESATMLAEAESRANAAGRSSYPPDVSFGLMWQSFTLGQLDATETHARSLLRVGDELKRYSFHSEARVLLCRVAQLRGDLTAAHEHLRHARNHVATDTSQELMLTVARSWLSHAEGDDDDALAAVDALIRPARPVRHRWLWQPGWLLPAMQIAMRGGDRELARRIASLTQTLYEHNPTVPTNAALAACAVGLEAGSAEALAGALEICRTSPRLMTRAQITSLLGRALLDDRRREAGVAALTDAWDLYTELGAHGEARKVQQLLQGAGVRRHRWTAAKPRPVDGWGSLTTSEDRVARLIAAGHTNRSAAEALVLSPNTIATHLRSVFSKLGVNSRVQLSLAAAGLPEQGAISSRER